MLTRKGLTFLQWNDRKHNPQPDGDGPVAVYDGRLDMLDSFNRSMIRDVDANDKIRSLCVQEVSCKSWSSIF